VQVVPLDRVLADAEVAAARADARAAATGVQSAFVEGDLLR